MEYRVLETRSADILTKYYSNEIDSFLNACHEDILWIGPAEKHVIRTRKALVDAFSQEDAFSISTRYVPFADDFSRKWLPVLLHHASASRGKPASVACISRRSPGFRVSMLFFSFIIGPGH